jgi:transposase
MLTSGLLVVLLHGNARPHTASDTRAHLEHFHWELFDHPPYSPDLAPSDYHLFIYLKKRLRWQFFNNNEKMMEGTSQATADFFDIGVQELIPR